jgi:ABC-type glutathione transport system ATPase component
MLATVSVAGVSKAYGDVRAVSQVSCEVNDGQVLGLIGESGSGKSTLGRLLVGLEQPDEGTVVFEGRNLGGRRSRSDRRAIQIVFQDPLAALNPRLSIAQSIEDFLIVHRLGNKSERREQVRHALDNVQLSEAVAKRRPSELSGGQRQRACIARALVVEPRVLVADEPTSALDVSIQGQILNLIVDLKDAKRLALVFITHDMAVVRFVADTIAVMRSGRIVEMGPKEQITSNPRNGYTQRLLEVAHMEDPVTSTGSRADVREQPN